MKNILMGLVFVVALFNLNTAAAQVGRLRRDPNPINWRKTAGINRRSLPECTEGRYGVVNQIPNNTPHWLSEVNMIPSNGYPRCPSGTIAWVEGTAERAALRYQACLDNDRCLRLCADPTDCRCGVSQVRTTAGAARGWCLTEDQAKDLVRAYSLTPLPLVPIAPAPPMPVLTYCSDGQKNGYETDVDCGGGGCPPCRDYYNCMEGSDCLSGICFKQKCQPASCHDGKKNGYETDMDCGGHCPPCDAPPLFIPPPIGPAGRPPPGARMAFLLWLEGGYFGAPTRGGPVATVDGGETDMVGGWGGIGSVGLMADWDWGYGSLSTGVGTGQSVTERGGSILAAGAANLMFAVGHPRFCLGLYARVVTDVLLELNGARTVTGVLGLGMDVWVASSVALTLRVGTGIGWDAREPVWRGRHLFVPADASLGMLFVIPGRNMASPRRHAPPPPEGE